MVDDKLIKIFNLIYDEYGFDEFLEDEYNGGLYGYSKDEEEEDLE